MGIFGKKSDSWLWITFPKKNEFSTIYTKTLPYRNSLTQGDGLNHPVNSNTKVFYLHPWKNFDLNYSVVQFIISVEVMEILYRPHYPGRKLYVRILLVTQSYPLFTVEDSLFSVYLRLLWLSMNKNYTKRDEFVSIAYYT